MSQNASRSTKGGGPPSASGTKVFSKQDISNNVKYSQNNNTFNNKSTKLLNNNTTSATMNTNNSTTNGSLDENHNQHHHADKNGTIAQPLKPTAEQVRLASLLNGKSDDPEINKKIKQVLDILSDKNQDEVLMALHESDYDVSKAINLLVEGITPLQDWTTVGLKKKQSSNQTSDETGGGDNTGNQGSGSSVSGGVSSSTNNFGKNKNNSNNSGGGGGGNNKNQRSKERDRDRTRGGGSSRPSRKFNDSNFHNDSNNNNNLDERFENLGIKDGEFKSYTSNFSNSDINYAENGNNLNENDFDARGRSNSNKRSNFRNNNGGGSGRGRGGGPSGRNNNSNRNNNINNNNNGFRNGGFQRGPRNKNFNNRNKDHNHHPVNLTDENNLTNENELTSHINENLNEKLNVNLNANVVNNSGEEVTSGEIVADLVNDDNLRDIGTWSNDHASKRKSAGSNVSNTSNHQRQSAQSNNRFNSNNKNANNNNNVQSNSKSGALNQEDWENEEEWQGDLTKTQIFTASTQKKESAPEAKSFDSNFPIGHFNAEEATQNIKKAVGIGASANANMTNSSMTNKNIIQESKDNKLNNLSQQQQQQQQQKKLVIGSVKPPPPSTKIPKSAVIMPEVGSNSSTNFSLDVQFGVDLDSTVSNIVHPVVNSSTMQQQQQMPSHSTSYSNPNLLNEKTKPLNVNAIGSMKNTHQPPNNNMPSAGNSSSSATGSKVLNTDSAIIKPAPINGQSSATTTTNVTAAASGLASSSAANQIKSNNNLEQNLISKSSTNNIQTQHQINSMNASSNLLHTPNGSQQHHQNNANFDNKKLNQDNQSKSNFNQTQQQQHHQSNMPKQQVQQQAPIKQHHSQQQQQQYINHLTQSETTNMLHQQQQSQPQQHHQQQQHYQQHQSSSTNSQLLNVSPQNVSINNNNSKTANVQNTQQSGGINQLQQQLGQNQTTTNNNISTLNQANNTGLGQSNQLNATAAAVATAAALANANVNKTGATSAVMAPPPGVNMVNPSNQFLMSLPFQQNGLQNFSYFDPSQIDSGLMQMYNHLASVPPGVNSATPGAGTTPGPQYPISDSKFNRNDSSNKNSLNSSANAAQLPQQQQPINLIPNLSNFPIFFQHYYPNMFMSMPNGPQANPQQFQQQQQQQQNKLPYNFNNNTSVGGGAGGGGVYEDQTKDYNSYNPQNQIKPSSGSNLNNVSDLSGYQKNVEKNNAGGYHTPPPNFATSILNQQPHPNTASAQAQPQYTYITSMIGTPGQNMVHAGIQDNLNTRNVNVGSGNNGNMKSLPKANQFQNSSWN